MPASVLAESARQRRQLGRQNARLLGERTFEPLEWDGRRLEYECVNAPVTVRRHPRRRFRDAAIRKRDHPVDGAMRLRRLNTQSDLNSAGRRFHRGMALRDMLER